MGSLSTTCFAPTVHKPRVVDTANLYCEPYWSAFKKVTVTDEEAGAIEVPVLPSNIRYLLTTPAPRWCTPQRHREEILWRYEYDRLRLEGKPMLKMR